MVERTASQANIHPNESVARIEKRYEAHPKLVIAIAGVAGTGKTSTSEILASLLEMQMSSRGNEHRADVREQRGEEIVGLNIRTPDEDRALDARTIESIRAVERNENGATIIDGWLAPFMATQEMHRMEEENVPDHKRPRIVRILFTGDEMVRATRVWKRQIIEDPELTVEEVKEKNYEREHGNVAGWQNVYPDLAGINPLDAADTRARQFYDLILDTTEMSREEGLTQILSYLEEKNLIHQKKNQKSPLPQSGMLFNGSL